MRTSFWFGIGSSFPDLQVYGSLQSQWRDLIIFLVFCPPQLTSYIWNRMPVDFLLAIPEVVFIIGRILAQHLLSSSEVFSVHVNFYAKICSCSKDSWAIMYLP